VLHHALRNSAHVATTRFQNSSVSRIGTRYTRCCESYSVQTRLYQARLHSAWSKNQRAVLPTRVADAEAATSDRSIAGDMFLLFQQDIAPAHRARDRVELLRYLLTA